MKFIRATLETCGEARGVVVVIDVLRAFTTAAFALSAGAGEIILVGEVDEARQLRAALPGALMMGEVGGLPIEGFDYGNSPSALLEADLQGRTIIQRTSAGTQGVVLSTQAESMFACSFVCARATAAQIARLAPPVVTFVITGKREPHVHSGVPQRRLPGWGDEDAACADYLEGLLSGLEPDVAPLLERVRLSPPGQLFSDPTQPEFPAEDLDLCTAVDRFAFAMPVSRRDDRYVMTAVPSPIE